MESDHGLIFTLVHDLFRKTGLHPRIKSAGGLFPDHALKAWDFLIP